MRSEIGDCRLAPVENLATNPSFTRAVAGTTIVRRNHHPNPTLAVDRTGWVGGAGTLTTGVEAGYGSYGEVTSTGTAAFAANGVGTAGASLIAVKPGEVWSFGADVWTPDAATALASRLVYMRVTWYDSTPVATGGQMTGSATASTLTTARRRITLEGVVVPTGTAYARVDVYVWNPGTPASGHVLRFSRVQAERRPTLLPYFDGSTVDNSGIAYSWEGASSLSASIAKAAVVEVRRNYVRTPNLSTALTGWTVAASATPTPVADGVRLNFTAEQTAGAGAFYRTNGSDVPMAPGEVWSVTMKVRNDGASAVGMRASIGGTNSTSNGPIVSIAPGATEALTVTTSALPADTTAGRPVLRTGTVIPAGAVLTVLDGMTMEKAPVAGAPFTGELTPDADLTPAWTSTANASESVLYGVRMIDANSVNGAGGDLTAWRAYDPAVGYYGRFEIMSNPGSYRYVRIAPGQFGQIKAGSRITILAQVRTPPRDTSGLFGWGIRNGQGLPSPQTSRGPTTTSWAWVRVAIPIVQDGTGDLMIYLDGFNGTDKRLDIADVLAVNSAYPGPYIDGDMPGCIWRGTPHASTSAGYPRLA
ncbi:hypothetical protein MRBLMI12_000416 [Microbacterium sp. LMI12-1-1.1]|uniref:hypothetical protein n=1 Tax=Microbacterium sp. LMI12-1-1.1 TaxID=3135225 RepID=UPI003429D328